MSAPQTDALERAVALALARVIDSSATEPTPEDIEQASVVILLIAQAQRDADVDFVQEYGGAQDVTVCGQALSSQPLITSKGSSEPNDE